MELPKKAIFGFNANLDHVKKVEDKDLEMLELHLPEIYSKMNESFSWGVQKEVAIDANICDFFLNKMGFEKTIVGGQAGNAVEQATALGIDCFLHSAFPSPELFKLFSRKERVFVATSKGFENVKEAHFNSKSSHHFVFEHSESRTRFIASYDPYPMHPEDEFCMRITEELPGIGKAFLGGLHLVKTVERVEKFSSEVKKWKEINPELKVFLELGEFQNREVLGEVRRQFFPLIDYLGMNDIELSSLGADMEELAGEVPAILFHTPEKQQVFPEEKKNLAALDFAKRCASFKAMNGTCAEFREIALFKPEFVDSPELTVGLGDVFSSSYFMAL